MKFSENRETLANIAALYYLGDLTQDKIAEMYGISRCKVSRLLKRCKTLRIVEFRIDYPPTYYAELAEQVRTAYGLKSVTVTRSGSTADESKRNTGQALARFLEERIRDGMYIGMSWGSTIQNIVPHFSPSGRYPNTTFVQLSGNMLSHAQYNEGYMDGREIVQSLAAKARANWSIFQAPYVVQNEMTRTLLLSEDETARHVGLFDRIDLAMISVASDQAENAVECKFSLIARKEFDALKASGISANICGTHISQMGETARTSLSNRMLTIDLNTLRKVPDVVAVGVGQDKVCSLVAGARSQCYNHLITDEIAAFSMIHPLSDK